MTLLHRLAAALRTRVAACPVCHGATRIGTGRAKVAFGRKLRRGETHATQVDCEACAGDRALLAEVGK